MRENSHVISDKHILELGAGTGLWSDEIQATPYNNLKEIKNLGIVGLAAALQGATYVNITDIPPILSLTHENLIHASQAHTTLARMQEQERIKRTL